MVLFSRCVASGTVCLFHQMWCSISTEHIMNLCIKSGVVRSCHKGSSSIVNTRVKVFHLRWWEGVPGSPRQNASEGSSEEHPPSSRGWTSRFSGNLFIYFHCPSGKQILCHLGLWKSANSLNSTIHFWDFGISTKSFIHCNSVRLLICAGHKQCIVNMILHDICFVSYKYHYGTLAYYDTWNVLVHIPGNLRNIVNTTHTHATFCFLFCFFIEHHTCVNTGHLRWHSRRSVKPRFVVIKVWCHGEVFILF